MLSCQLIINFFFASVEKLSVILQLFEVSVASLRPFGLEPTGERHGRTGLVDQVVSGGLQLFLEIGYPLLLHLTQLLLLFDRLLLHLEFTEKVLLLRFDDLCDSFIDELVEIVHL